MLLLSHKWCFNTWYNIDPVTRYSAGIIKWTQTEIDAVAHKPMNLLTVHNGFTLHLKTDVHQLYLPRKAGGHGPLNVKQR